MMYSHPEYVNYSLATKYLKSRMGMNSVDFELLPHSISHTTSKRTRIIAKALKIRCTYDARQSILTGLLECLKKESRTTN